MVLKDITIVFILPCPRTPEFEDAPKSIKVYNTSLVRFSKRVNFDIGCNMDFKMFPVDVHECEIKFESYAYQQTVSIQMKNGIDFNS